MPDLPFDITDPRLAAASWSRIAESPDPAAGALVAELGAGQALDWLLDVLGGRIAAIDRRWEQSIARWAPRVAGLDIRRQLDALTLLEGQLVVRGDPCWP